MLFPSPFSIIFSIVTQVSSVQEALANRAEVTAEDKASEEGAYAEDENDQPIDDEEDPVESDESSEDEEDPDSSVASDDEDELVKDAGMKGNFTKIGLNQRFFH